MIKAAIARLAGPLFVLGSTAAFLGLVQSRLAVALFGGLLASAGVAFLAITDTAFLGR